VRQVSEAATPRASRSGRRRRSDAGSIRASARDLELLRFTGEQFALTLPQLARLMGRSEHAARWLRSRWHRAGWAQGRALLVGEPVFVWLTRHGLSAAGRDYSVWKPNPGALAHIAAVTEGRLCLRKRRPEALWVCERELARDSRRELGGFGAHRPDGLLVQDGRELAIEVELTLKRRSRAELIMREQLARYGSVLYFAAPAPKRMLEALASELGGGRVQVRPLPGGEHE
jgi:hypothetical protein